jgi:hypothetical protein
VALVMTYALSWVIAARDLLRREDGQDGLEYLAVAAVIVAAVGIGYAAQSGLIESTISNVISTVASFA